MFTRVMKWLRATGIVAASATALSAQETVVGRWEGAIHVMGIELDITVEFTERDGELGAAIDIPQQGARGVPLQQVRGDGEAVHFELPAGPGLAVFDGNLVGDSIGGVFTQSGAQGTFSLLRSATGPADDAITEDLPYDSEEVEFNNGGVTLAGTLTLPRQPGSHPAVVMITGSGPQNRDEEVFGFKVFRVLADHLTRNGIAVLRYDDRGVGGSSGTVAESTSEDFAGDALSAVRLLRERDDIDAARIGLLGHSEGGLVAPIAALRSDHVAFLVLLASPAVRGAEILLAQVELILRASGASETEVQEQRHIQERAIAVVRSGEGWEEIAEIMREQAREVLERMNDQQRAAIVDRDLFIEQRAAAALAGLQSRWFAYFIDYDPAAALREIRVPVLGLYGALDLQVPLGLNRPEMESALRESRNEDVTIRVFAGANHLFQAAVTGSPSEYPTLRKEFVPGFLDLIADWIHERTANSQSDEGH